MSAHADRKDVPADNDRNWIGALKSTYRQAAKDNAGIVAAGVAYYAFLAFVPLLAAMALGYGLFADPETVAGHAQMLAGSLPSEAAKLITEQLESATQEATGTKGLGLLIALALALFSARGGATALITALNIAYDIREERSFLRKNVLALLMTVGAIIGLALVITTITLVNVIDGVLGQIAAFLVTFGFATMGAALLYRIAPHRDAPAFRYQLPGALFFAAAISLLTALFSFYVANFGNYNATYGSLGAVVVLLTWLYIAAYALLFGAELNAPSEHTDSVQH